jgi:hypothetical protein
MTVINHSFIEKMINIIKQETYLFTIKTNIIEKNIFVHYYTISKNFTWDAITIKHDNPEKSKVIVTSTTITTQTQN